MTDEQVVHQLRAELDEVGRGFVPIPHETLKDWAEGWIEALPARVPDEASILQRERERVREARDVIADTRMWIMGRLEEKRPRFSELFASTVVERLDQIATALPTQQEETPDAQ